MAKRAQLGSALKKYAAEKGGTTAQRGAVKASSKRDGAAAKAQDGTKAMTLRLNKVAWRQLRDLALDDERPAHSVLVDALNAYFETRGKPPVA